MRVLGVEPAGGVAEIARAKGVPTVTEFFGLETARRLVAEHGHPRLVAANNVMAHVPDLQDFAAGLAALCDERTIITVENPSFIRLLHEAQFDTIYHEHFSYLTAHALTRVVEPVGLRLVRVDALPTHGGSNRYWLSADQTRPRSTTVSPARSRTSSRPACLTRRSGRTSHVAARRASTACAPGSTSVAPPARWSSGTAPPPRATR